MANPAPFLASGPSGSSGLLILQYVAHSVLADVRHQTTPLSAGPVALSLGTEDHASFAPLAAGRLTAAINAYRTVLACELVAAARALRMRATPVPEPLLPMLDLVAAALGDNFADRSVETDLDAATALLSRMDGRLTLVVRCDGGRVLLFQYGFRTASASDRTLDGKGRQTAVPVRQELASCSAR